jgi:hypothetical protein
VETWSEGSGNGAIAGRELPADRAILADRHVRVLARALQQEGMGGTLEQISAEVFLAVLTGQSPDSLLAAAGQHDTDEDAMAGQHGAGEDEGLPSGKLLGHLIKVRNPTCTTPGAGGWPSAAM